MAPTVRRAVPADLDAMAALTAAGRRRLAGWSPRWWAVADRADDLHRLWLGHLIGAEGHVVRVADDGGTVVGCAVSLPQPGQWMVDDLQVADARWEDAGAALLAAVAERPALHCAASADVERLAACAAAGLTAVARYWVGPPTPGSAPPGPVPPGPRAPGPAVGPVPPAPGTALSGPAGASGAAPVPLPAGTPVAPGPAHTFGASLDPHAPGAIALTDGNGGVVVASPPVPAPPVYAPGGPVAVIDRVTGDRARLLDAALAAVAARGDVLVAVVAAPDDDGLATLLAERGLGPTVDVLAWR